MRVGMGASAANAQGCVFGRAAVSGAATLLLEADSAMQRLDDVNNEPRCQLRR
jgi:hypothetical protein